MTDSVVVQYVIVGVIVACVALLAVRRMIKRFNGKDSECNCGCGGSASRTKKVPADFHCAGCAFLDTCKTHQDCKSKG